MSKTNFVTALLTAMLLLLAGIEVSQAALPAIVGTTLTGVSDDALDLIDLVWPVVGAVTGGFILFKLFKRGASKI